MQKEIGRWYIIHLNNARSENVHNAKSAIHENNGLTIGEQKNGIRNFYNLLLTEFRDMCLVLRGGGGGVGGDQYYTLVLIYLDV